jgi:hypothetical protein
MADVNAGITTRPDLTRAKNEAFNLGYEFNAFDYLLGRAPEYYVYLYNVSEEVYKVSRPPIAKEIILVGRPKGKKFQVCGRFPQPMVLPRTSVDQSAMGFDTLDARRFAMDVINSENLTLNQDAVIDARNSFSVGHDLGKKGVFWSLNGPGNVGKRGPNGEELLAEPTEKEINRAYDRMEGYYKFLIDQADTVQASAPAKLGEILSPEHHAACEYFGEERQWHAKRSRPADCPNCGARIKEGMAYHIDASGDLCIIDWERTVKSGKRTRAQAFEATGDPKFAPKEATVAVAEVPQTPAAPKVVRPTGIPSE